MPAGMIGTPLSRPHTDEVFYISAVKGAQSFEQLEKIRPNGDNSVDSSH